MTGDFEMPVSSLFNMPNQGTVLAGLINRGGVAIGDHVTIASPGAAKDVVVAGLEQIGTRKFLDSATQGQEIAILCRGLQIEDLADGLERIEEGGWKVVSLTVRSADSGPLRWWNRIWKFS